MNYDEMINNLEYIKNKHKNDTLGVGQTNIELMADDCLRFIKEQQKQIEELKWQITINNYPTLPNI